MQNPLQLDLSLHRNMTAYCAEGAVSRPNRKLSMYLLGTIWPRGV